MLATVLYSLLKASLLISYKPWEYCCRSHFIRSIVFTILELAVSELQAIFGIDRQRIDPFLSPDREEGHWLEPAVWRTFS